MKVTVVPTVEIEHPTIEGETCVINKEDFDPEVHTLAEKVVARVSSRKSSASSRRSNKDG